MKFFVSTAKGLEDILLDELQKLGCQSLVKIRAGVEVEGTLQDAYRVCLNSRVANRVLLPLKTFDASNEQKLYAGVKSIKWFEHFDVNQTFAIDFVSTKSDMNHTLYGALKSKDAIVDQFRSRSGERPSVELGKPDVRINIYVLENQATVSIDLSGDSLHIRGYREVGAGAPLKENLADALLIFNQWEQQVCKAREEGAISRLTFLDPLCGSGTLLIEAAMIASQRAPGLLRRYWGFTKWKQHNSTQWNTVLKEAKDKIILEPALLPRVIGGDADPKALKDARINVENAGFGEWIQVTKKDAKEWKAPSTSGLIVTNPPYGERLGDVESLKPLYKDLGDLFKQQFKGWKAAIMTGSPELMKSVGLKTSRKHVVFNGAIECRLLSYEMY